MNPVSLKIFSVPPPWTIVLVSYSEKDARIDFNINYNSPVLTCPSCACQSTVTQLAPTTWKSADHIGCSTYITAYIPLTTEHLPGCRVFNGQRSLRDVILMDLIVDKIRYVGDALAFSHFFQAVGPINFACRDHR
jgi:hypothetical protein